MNILQIIPGSGGSFYCGNCLRDSKYFDALRKLGHKVVKIPMYLPLFADEHDLDTIPVFYGAVSIYLKQMYPVFRKAPPWFDNLLNSKPVLKLAATQAGSTRARDLEDMTVSMLLGEHGKQSEELERMVDWIAEHCRPDVIHLSNALLLGIAHRLKERLNVPVFCSLQDENTWVDVMRPEYRDQVWNLMSEKAQYVDAFISVSDYYAELSKQRMNLPDEKVHTVYLGVDPQDYRYKSSAEKDRIIGFISRMNYENGLDILVEAFTLLKKKPGFGDVKLILTGGHTGDDKKFLKAIHKTIRKNGLEDEVIFQEGFEGEDRLRFFGKVSVLSVPVRIGEAFGIYLTEAMASGIPVIQPSLGAFPEIVKTSGGGAVYEENTPVGLSEALENHLVNKHEFDQLSQKARKSIEHEFNIDKLAGKLVEVYHHTINQNNYATVSK
jgi:glycosyltransferase involved in cell wall biosynthesis